MLRATKIICFTGLPLFSTLFLIAAFAPKQVETAAKAYVVSQAKEEVARYFETPLGRNLAETYAALQERYAEEIEGSKAALKAKLHERIAEALSGLCHFDCETREQLKTALLEGLLSSIARLEMALARVEQLAQDKYSEVTRKIRRDLMIFSGTNSIIFALLLLLTFLRPGDWRALALPSYLMLIATAAASGIYVLGQDWFWVILTDSYMSYGYVAWVAVIFLLLGDIVYNEAQITLGIIDAFRSVLSACLPG